MSCSLLTSDREQLKARIAEFTARPVGSQPRYDDRDTWSSSQLLTHSDLISRAQQTVAEDHERCADADEVYDPLCGVSTLLEINDKKRMAELRKKYCQPDGQAALMHPHYCHHGGSLTGTDPTLNLGHRWPVMHRYHQTSQPHSYQHMRDTRDKMCRDAPLIEAKWKEQHQHTENLMQQVKQVCAEPLPPPPQDISGIALVGSTAPAVSHFAAVAGPVTGARGLKDAYSLSKQLGATEWGIKLGADQAWLSERGY